MDYRECYFAGAGRLQAAGVPEPEADARILLEYVCGTDRNTLLAHGDMPVEEEKQARYQDLIEKRASRVPLQLLTGEQCFCGLDFLVNEHVLIPRQDTEILVEAALKRLKPGMELLDLCTGSGCILISLLALTESVRGTGVDISKEALAVARENGSRLLPKEKQPEWF
ncbi:MAG: N5-glutamine methyltransferase family protein, partial [Lachnospiraceae bacterium]